MGIFNIFNKEFRKTYNDNSPGCRCGLWKKGVKGQRSRVKGQGTRVKGQGTRGSLNLRTSELQNLKTKGEGDKPNNPHGNLI